MKKIKAVYIIDDLNMGGAQKQFINLVKNINLNEFEVFVCSLSKEKKSLLPDLENAGIRIKIIDQKGKFDFKAFLELATFLKEIKPDIVHTYLFTASLYGRLAARLVGVPVVIVSERSTDLWKKKSYVLVDKFLALMTDKIIVNSIAIKDILARREKIGENKIFFIPNGIDTKRFIKKDSDYSWKRRELGISNNFLNIGIIGRLVEEKDHVTFLKAAEKVIKDGGDFNFLVIGDGPLKGQLLNFVRSAGLEKNVFFLGERKDIPEVLQIIHAVVSTSIYEGCSNAVLEAMAAGKPVVATDIEGSKGIVIDHKTGLLINVRDYEGLEKAIMMLSSDSSLCEKLVTASRNLVMDKFSLAALVKKHEELYKQLLGRHGK